MALGTSLDLDSQKSFPFLRQTQRKDKGWQINLLVTDMTSKYQPPKIQSSVDRGRE